MKAFLKKIQNNRYEIAEAIIVELVNFYIQIIYVYKKLLGKYSFLKKNINLRNIHKNKRIFVIANAPSINDFDLKKLKNEIVVMVNRSFNHPDYEIIQPNYHIIVDPKLANGVWPLSYIDTILKKNPKVKIILNADWYHLEKFNNIKKKDNVFWVKNKIVSLLFNNFNNDLTQNYSSLGVTGHGVSLSIFSGSKKIYILGMELNGIIYLINNQDSHFNGKDPDYKNHTALDWSKALSDNSRGIRFWHKYANDCKNNGVELINLSNKGLFDFVPKEDFNSLF
jgi:hypothetical protein